MLNLVNKGCYLRDSLLPLIYTWLLFSNPCTHYSNPIKCLVSDTVIGSVLPPEKNTNRYCSHQGCQQVSGVVECVCTCLLNGCAGMCNRFTFEVFLDIHTCYPNILTCVFFDRAVATMPSTLLYPLVTWTLLVVLFVYWTSVAMYPLSTVLQCCNYI